MSSIILEGYGKRNLIVTQGYVGVNAQPPDPPPPPPPTYFSVALATTTGGTIDPAAGNYTALTTASFTAAATASEGYHFLYWQLDGAPDSTETTIEITGVADQQRTLLAVFAANPPTPPATVTTYTLTIVEAAGGHTNLSAGEHIYDENTAVGLTANPDAGYSFAYWEVGTTTAFTSSITLTLTSDLTVTPVFAQNNPPIQGDTALTMANLWTNLLAKMQAQGVNTAVTIHALELGADDGITGQPSKYWNDVAGDMIINPDGTELQHFQTGSHTKLTAKGFTAALVTDGDEITDTYGNTWAITEVIPYKIGGYTQCTLNLKLESNFIHPPHPPNTKRIVFHIVDYTDVYSFPYTFPINLA